jgi:glycerol-3-phosphate acyltransferase PlsX
VTTRVRGGSPRITSDDRSDVIIALDLLGGDAGPEVVADAALAVLDHRPGVDLLLVGPPELATPLLQQRGLIGRVELVPAVDHVRMDEDPVSAVRGRPGVSVRVACDLVRDRRADATVTVGHTGAALAAATFSLGRLPGVTRAAVAAIVPALLHDVVLLDAGGTTDATPELLGQFARSGDAFARALGLGDEPRIGLLTVGSEPGKGDALRRAAHEVLGRLPLNYVGGVEGADIAHGGRADVVVTDGFTGNVVLKALEGATATALARISAAYDDAGPAHRAVTERDARSHGGAVLLGVDGVSVIGHGGSTASDILDCVTLATDVVRADLLARTAAALSDAAPQRIGATR